jgi:hypothetical protein
MLDLIGDSILLLDWGASSPYRPGHREAWHAASLGLYVAKRSNEGRPCLSEYTCRACVYVCMIFIENL